MNQTLQFLIKDYLDYLGVPPNLTGYRIISIIIWYLKDNEGDFTMKELMYFVGEALDMSREQVEYNLRYAINVVWNENKWEKLGKFTRRPTAKVIAQKIQTGFICYQFEQAMEKAKE